MQILLQLVLALGVQAQPSPSEALLKEADRLIGQSRLPEAEKAARAYLQDHPKAASGHFTLGYILFLQTKAKESLAEYTEGAKYQAPDARDLKVVGSDYVVLGDFSDADRWFTKVVEWTPQDVQAWYDLGRTKYNENRFDEAIAAFQKTLQLDSSHVKAEDNLGLSYAALGNDEQAIASFQLALSLQAKSGERNDGPALDYGSLLLELNRTDEALPLLKQALALAPGDFRVHRELGKAYLHLGRLPDAQSELKTAIELSPKSAPLHFMLAQVYRKEGLLDKAKAETDRYTELK